MHLRCRHRHAWPQVWCEDFVGDGTIKQPASCCHQDDDIALGWCKQAGAEDDPRYSAACSPFDPAFGEANWAVGDDGSLQAADETRWQDVAHESGFCEVLGRVRAGCCCRCPPHGNRESACGSLDVAFCFTALL